jgi:hypothetical protein
VGHWDQSPVALSAKAPETSCVTRVLPQFEINRRWLVLFLGVGLVALFAARPLPAVAKGGPVEVRVAGVCGSGATSKLRLRARDGVIGVRFEVDHGRGGEVWRVVLVHERRVDWKGSAKTTRPGGLFEIERTLTDLPGADEISVRAWGPRGLVCNAVAVLPDS